MIYHYINVVYKILKIFKIKILILNTNIILDKMLINV